MNIDHTILTIITFAPLAGALLLANTRRPMKINEDALRRRAQKEESLAAAVAAAA